MLASTIISPFLMNVAKAGYTNKFNFYWHAICERDVSVYETRINMLYSTFMFFV